MRIVKGVLCLPLFCLGLTVISSFAAAELSVADEALARKLSQAREALYQLDYDKAGKLAGEVAAASDDAELQLETADILLRSGNAKQSIKGFDRYLKRRPEAKPYLWQRGIALYFAGQYAEGAEQFEVHRKVNSNDVENAAWHFLCVAKKDDPETAKKLVLPAPGDARAPMEEVLAMLSNGDTQTVVKRMESFEPGPRRNLAEFYGYLYLGLYADALGKSGPARQHMARSAKDAPKNYMGDVARLYASHLESAAKKTKPEK